MPPIHSVELCNTRCFAQTTLRLHPRLTIIIGENGAGKTTLAEALASLSYGEKEGWREFPLRHEATSGHIVLRDEPNGDPSAQWQVGTHDVRQRLPSDRYLFAYGRYRRVFFEEDFPDRETLTGSQLLEQLASEVLRDRTTTLTRPDGRLMKNLGRYFRAAHAGRRMDPRMEALWDHFNDSLKQLGHGLKGVVMQRGETDYVPKLLRNNVELGINELSDGYQAILVIVFDLLFRYYFLFSWLDEPWLGSATVVIDEIDLHLHLRWQRTVLNQLSELFPQTQFVVTTHSAAVIQGAIDRGDEADVVVLREKQDGVEAVPLGPTTKQRLQGADLTSVAVEQKLFDVESRYSTEYQELEQEITKLRKKVEQGTAGEDEEDRLFELFEIFEKLMVKEEERRADGAFLSEMVKLRRAFLKDLADERKKQR